MRNIARLLIFLSFSHAMAFSDLEVCFHDLTSAINTGDLVQIDAAAAAMAEVAGSLANQEYASNGNTPDAVILRKIESKCQEIRYVVRDYSKVQRAFGQLYGLMIDYLKGLDPNSYNY